MGQVFIIFYCIYIKLGYNILICILFSEHVWQVSLINRGFGTIGLMGNHRLCVTEDSITLINIERLARTPTLVFMLSNIRSCGHLGCFLFIEVSFMLNQGRPVGT